MPEIGGPELLIILAIVLIIFGPGRLAGAGGALGEALREFRHGFQDKAKNNPSVVAESDQEEPGI